MATVVLPQGPGDLVVVTRFTDHGTGPGAWRGTIHAATCPSGRPGRPLAALMASDEAAVRRKIRVGVLAACGRCRPELIVPAT